MHMKSASGIEFQVGLMGVTKTLKGVRSNSTKEVC
jgi:hypothetical protein